MNEPGATWRPPSSRPPTTDRWPRPSALTAMVVMVGAVASGCSLLGADEVGTAVSVFDVEPGQCFVAPVDVQAELDELLSVPCSKPHAQEAYASVVYTPAPGADGYPGDSALATFADGACAEAYGDYVGVDYLDSALFFTYLLPSARGWEQERDHSVLCFVTTTGEPLTGSVEGSGR